LIDFVGLGDDAAQAPSLDLTARALARKGAAQTCTEQLTGTGGRILHAPVLPALARRADVRPAATLLGRRAQRALTARLLLGRRANLRNRDRSKRKQDQNASHIITPFRPANEIVAIPRLRRRLSR
jgi:hypothetical protein